MALCLNGQSRVLRDYNLGNLTPGCGP